MSGISIIYPVYVSTFLGLTPITNTYCCLFILPENIRAKPITVDSSSIPLPRPLSLICFLERVIILDTNIIKGAYYWLSQ